MSSQLSHHFLWFSSTCTSNFLWSVSLSHISFIMKQSPETQKREHGQVKRSTLFFGAVFCLSRSYVLKEWGKKKKSFQKQKKVCLVEELFIVDLHSARIYISMLNLMISSWACFEEKPRIFKVTCTLTTPTKHVSHAHIQFLWPCQQAPTVSCTSIWEEWMGQSSVTK